MMNTSAPLLPSKAVSPATQTSIRQPWLPRRPISIRTVAWSVLLGIALVTPAMLLSSSFPVSDLARRQFATVGFAPVGTLLTHVLLGPALEEIVYRGFLLQLARRYLPLSAALLLSSVLFGLTHFAGGWGWVVPTVALGGLLGWLALRSGTLYVSFLCHAAFNFASGFVVAPMFGLSDKIAAVPPGAYVTDPLTALFPAWWVLASAVAAAGALAIFLREFRRGAGA